jgi:hypothetical protein
MPNIPLQAQDTPPLSSSFQPLDPQDSLTPALLNPAVDSQIDDQSPVPPVEELKSHRHINNPYVNPPVHQLAVVNKVGNTCRSPETYHGQTVVALAHRYRQTTNNVDWELTKLP